MNVDTWTPILQAVVGSQAYGLATPESDEDRMCVAMAPSGHFFSLSPPTGRTASHAEREPDRIIHELGKFVALALKCNPSILELLWLEDYEIITPVGQELIELRRSFLSRRLVRDAFLEYATAQFKRFIARGNGTFSSDTRNRTLKHARHLYRLVLQGYALYTIGDMTVKVIDRDAVFQFAEMAVADPAYGQGFLERSAAHFDEAKSPLPEEPATAEIDLWLQGVRIRHLVNPVVQVSRSIKE